MTDDKARLGTAQPGRGQVSDTLAVQETTAVDSAPKANPRSEVPTRRQFRLVRIVAFLVVGAAASWFYVSEVRKNVGTAPPAMPVANDRTQINQTIQKPPREGEQSDTQIAADVARLGQALQQEHAKGERSARELSAELAELKRAVDGGRDQGEQLARKLATDMAELEQKRDKGEGLARELTAHVARLEQSLQQKGAQGEQPDSRLAADVAHLKEALEHERGKGELQVRDLAAELARLKQALQEEHDRSDRLLREPGAELAKLKQALQQGDQQVRDLAAELALLKQAQQQERGKGEQLANRLAGDLAQLKQVLQQTEERSAIYEKLLGQEHDRNRDLEEQLAGFRDAAVSGRSGKAASDRSGMSAPTQGPAIKQPVNAPRTGDKAAIPAVDKPATMAARPEAPRAPGDLETVRLMERANLLVAQGDVGAARNVLERAVESGNAAALFALAETHDPVVLAAWGTLGTQGDVAKAKELYARALMGGIAEAQHRLDVLP
jgi:septal ring factor EnvC (AmiA/AmiB activator)